MSVIPNLVSVSIPFKNSAAFLAEAIESVLSQTNADWELVLVDDGSGDGSREIAQDYALRMPEKVRYVEHAQHRNLGVTRSRNLGASISRGEYLAFLDSDDVWLPAKLEHQVAVLKEHAGAGAIISPSEYWFEDNSPEGEQSHTPPLAPGERIYSPPDLFLMTHPIGQSGAPCPSSILVRRTAFNAIDGFVEDFHPGTRQLLEDSAFLTKLYLTEPVYVSSRCTDRYRCHSQSIWHRILGTTDEEAERRFYFSWLHDYLKAKGIKDRSIWRAVRRESWMYDVGLPNSITRQMRRRRQQLRSRLSTRNEISAG